MKRQKTKKLSKLIYFFVTFLFLTFLDFYFSGLIISKLLTGWRFSSQFISINYAENTGAAFSILQNSTNFLIGLSIVALFAISYFVIRNLDSIRMKECFFLAFMVAGVVGNLYERVTLGFVRDFFDIPFINFPIFNISDIFINIGVIGIIILIIVRKKPIKLL